MEALSILSYKGHISNQQTKRPSTLVMQISQNDKQISPSVIFEFLKAMDWSQRTEINRSSNVDSIGSNTTLAP